MILHNLKVAVRNLLKYRLQTLISVLGIAIGIVTLAMVHSAMSRVKIPDIYSQPYYERTFAVGLVPADGSGAGPNSAGSDMEHPHFTRDILRALKRDGGLGSVERMAVSYGMVHPGIMEFHLSDSTTRKSMMDLAPIDPEYFNLMGLRSAITGKAVRRLEPGEAIISREEASKVFGDANPVGAVRTRTSDLVPVPLTIVDVFDDLSSFEALDNHILYYSLGGVEGDLCGAHDGRGGELFCPDRVRVVMREGCTRRQLQDELDARLRPFGVVAKLEDGALRVDVREIVVTRMCVHLIGALILIAAVIGFLRMQLQLFWIRRHEMVLRITHGARRRQLFSLLFTEVMLVVGMSVAVAMLMGRWVENFIYTQLAHTMSDAAFSIRNLAACSLCIGLPLLIVCALAIRVGLARICGAGVGLAVHMRGSRTHLFRNVMLGLQIAISTVFLCGTFTVARWSGLMLRTCHLPDDRDFYKECLYLNATDAQERLIPLLEEMERLPSLEKVMAHIVFYLPVLDIENSPEAKTAFSSDMGNLPFLCTADTSVISFYRLPVRWLQKPVGSGACLLLNDSIYAKLRGAGLASAGTLTIRRWGWYGADMTLPIAGVVPNIPYQDRRLCIMVLPDIEKRAVDYVLVPKRGQSRSLVREAEETVRRIEPSIEQPMVHNFHDYQAPVAGVIESMRLAGWILGGVSILICVMGIYSTVTLDTRSRRKEVAIRKVCGAKSRDIYRLFGRVYLLVVLLSLLIALPVAVLFHRMVFSEDMGDAQAWAGTDISPLVSCLAGSLIIVTLIAVVVVWNIRSTMRTNPSEIIAKE